MRYRRCGVWVPAAAHKRAADTGLSAKTLPRLVGSTARDRCDRPRRRLLARSSQSRMLRLSTLLAAACNPYPAITRSTVHPCSARSIAAAMFSGGSRCAAAARRRRRAARAWRKSRMAAAVRVQVPASAHAERYIDCPVEAPTHRSNAIRLCHACRRPAIARSQWAAATLQSDARAH